MDYKLFFGLKESPFKLSPDPKFFFPSNFHKEALDTLLYSISAGEAFVQITGEPGTGKTLLVRTILQEKGDNTASALILNPRLSPEELLRALLDDLGIDISHTQNQSKEVLLRSFRNILLEEASKGKKIIVIVDEAQNLPNDTLEELRLLSNLETEKEKLLQIVLVGQIELEEKLRAPELKQLDQRITIRYRLKRLSKEETQAYVRYRLQIASNEGGRGNIEFEPAVLSYLHKVSKGIPRLINIICERALMAAFVDGEKKIKKIHIKKAIISIRGNQNIKMLPRVSMISIIMAIIILTLSLLNIRYKIFTLPSDSNSIIEKKVNNSEILIDAPKLKKENDDKSKTSEIKSYSIEKTLVKKEDTIVNIPNDPNVQSLNTHETVPAYEINPLMVNSFYNAENDSVLISVVIDQKTAYIWESRGAKLTLVSKFEYTWTMSQGLFIIVKDIRNNYLIFDQKSGHWINTHKNDFDSKFLEQISKINNNHIIPLAAFLSKTEIKEGNIEQSKAIKDTFNGWANAWRAKDINLWIQFYGDLFNSYNIYSDNPTIISKQQFYEEKSKIFQKSGAISLEVSNPLFLIDPSNPDSGMAIFYQKYQSKVYNDKGIKILYLQKDNNLKNFPDWKIKTIVWLNS